MESSLGDRNNKWIAIIIIQIFFDGLLMSEVDIF